MPSITLRPYDPSRPLHLFDQAGAAEPSDPFAVLEKARDTADRYFARLDYEEWENTNEGLAAILRDPEFDKKVTEAAALRDRELRRETERHERHQAAREQEHRERMAKFEDAHRQRVAILHEQFESRQRGAMGFHGRRTFEALKASAQPLSTHNSTIC